MTPAMLTALVHHYAREGHWRQIQTTCKQILKKKGGDGYFLFWKAYGVCKEGNWTKAIQQWEQIKRNRDVAFPTHLALIWANENTDLPDHEAIDQLSSALRNVETRATPDGKLLAATFSWLTGDIDAARRIVDGLLDHQEGDQVRALALRGWIDLTGVKTGDGGLKKQDSIGMGTHGKEEELFQKSFQYFDQALSLKKRDLEAIMGKAKYWELKALSPKGKPKYFENALDNLDMAIAAHDWFIPALSEKAKMLMMLKDWDQALDTTERVLNKQLYSDDIESLRIAILHALTQSGNAKLAAKKISLLIDSIDRHEPKNAQLYYNCAKPFARLAGRKPIVLKQTLKLIDRAKQLQPTNSAFVTESAHQNSLLGDLRKANNEFKQGASLDDANVQAVTGMIYCQLSAGQLLDAQHQIDFMKEIQGSDGSGYELTFLSALLAWRKDRKLERAVRLLDQCLKQFNSNVTNSGSSNVHDYYVNFDVDFQLQVAKEYIQHCGAEPIDQGDPTPVFLQKGLNVLEKVAKEVPGMLQVQLSLAKARFLDNDFDSAEKVLSQCLRLDPQYSAAHLIMAQISLYQENYRGALNSLEQAVASDFTVRESPLYHLIKSRVLDGTGNIKGCIEILETALKLPGVTGQIMEGKNNGGEQAQPLSLHDRASIYIALADAHTKLNETKKAHAIIKQAQKIFEGTPEEVRVIIANSELSLKRGKVKRAIAQLSRVRPDSAAYTKAQTVLAKIYLTQMNDKRQYIKCYRTMLEQSPAPRTQVLLGDAYMYIQEPEKAIEAYEEALRMNPDDHSLTLLIGRALVKTHEFSRAIDYYEDALKANNAKDRGNTITLRLDLARLYLKLKKFDAAAKMLKRSRRDAEGDSVLNMVGYVGILLLIAEVSRGMEQSERQEHDVEDPIDIITSAKKKQEEILARARTSEEVNLQEQRHVAATLEHKLGELYEEENDHDKAAKCYQAASMHDNSYEPAILSLAKLYLKQNELQSCQTQCGRLMQIDPNHEEAAMILADAMFRKRQKGEAVHHYNEILSHFKEVLDKKPDNYGVLHRMILLLRRVGKLDEVEKVLEAAEKFSPKAQHQAGYMFCKGVYLRYTNRTPEAIRALNKARKSGEWGEKALVHMIELYLNPTNEEMMEDINHESGEPIRIAEKLLREIRRRPKPRKVLVLEAYALMSTRQKQMIEKAVQRLVDLVSKDNTYVPAICAMANALMLLNQKPKARNQLKRISKMTYDPDYADDFERGWLMLANIYIGQGKYDLSEKLCNLCKTYNQSCGKAYQHLGLIKEKELSYAEAADYYEKAWKSANELNPEIGYALAFNYLKDSRHLDAIRICHKVLKSFPEYPKIKKEILLKARQNLRP